MKNQGAFTLISLILKGLHPPEEGLEILKHNHRITGGLSEDGTQFTGWDDLNKESIDIKLNNN